MVVRTRPDKTRDVEIMDKVLLSNPCPRCGGQELELVTRIDVTGSDEKISFKAVCGKCDWSITASGSKSKNV